jgi:MFS family permease
VYALVGAAAAIAAAVGPLIGGFITTFLSWRVGFLLELVVIGVVLSGLRLIRDVPFTGTRGIDLVGAALSVLGMGGIVLGILVWQEGGEAVALLMLVGALSLGALAWWLVRRKRSGGLALLDPDLFRSPHFRLGISSQLLQQTALGGAMIALPIFLQMVLGYDALQAGLSLAPLSLSMFAVSILAGRRASHRRPSRLIWGGFGLLTLGMLAIIPLVPRVDSGLWLAIPLLVSGSGLGLLVSQLNAFTLAPIDEEHISEAAGVNSAGGSFGLSFGLALAGGLMLAALALSFTRLAETSTVLPPDDQQQIAQVLNEDAELMSDSQLQAQLAGQPEAIAQEVLRINDEARDLALQVALLVPLVAGIIGLLASIRMSRLPDITPTADLEGVGLAG